MNVGSAYRNRCHLDCTARYFNRADRTALSAECGWLQQRHMSAVRDWGAAAALGSAVRVCALFDDAVSC